MTEIIIFRKSSYKDKNHVLSLNYGFENPLQKIQIHDIEAEGRQGEGDYPS